MTFPRLETERLHLIEVEEQHIDKIYDIFSREDVTRFYGMTPFQEKEQALKMVQSFSSNYEQKRGIRWGIVLKDTGELVGTVGLNNLQAWGKRTEIGYDLHPYHWKKGIASEAIKEVINYSFGELELYRIAAITFPENEASFKILLKLGFQKEGLLRGYIYQAGKSHDALIFSLIKSDWIKD